MTCFPGWFPESFDMWKHSANCKILCKCSSIIVWFGQPKLAQISALQHNRHKYHRNFNQMFSGQPSCWWHRDPSSLHFETLQSPRILWARPKRDIHLAHSNAIGQNSTIWPHLNCKEGWEREPRCMPWRKRKLTQWRASHLLFQLWMSMLLITTHSEPSFFNAPWANSFADF